MRCDAAARSPRAWGDKRGLSLQVCLAGQVTDTSAVLDQRVGQRFGFVEAAEGDEVCDHTYLAVVGLLGFAAVCLRGQLVLGGESLGRVDRAVEPRTC